MIMTGRSDKQPCLFFVTPSAIVCYFFCVTVCTYNGTGDLRQHVFDNEIVSGWRRMLHDDDCDIRKDALKILGLAITYSMLHLYVFVLVSVFTPGQVTFITRCLILRQFPYGGGRYTMIP